MDNSIVQQVSSNNSALSAEHYQTYEMAKANDDILNGNDIAQIRSYAAYARAQAQAIHKTIAATSGIDDVAAIKAEATETAQTFARVGIYADQRIGEILRGMEQAKRGPKVNSDVSEKTKADAIAEAGIPKSQAYDLQKLAANPEIVELVISNAEIEGTIPSRSQVLKAIKEREDARKDANTFKRQRDEARHAVDGYREDVDGYTKEIGDLQKEIDALEKQVDKAYENGYRAASGNPNPQIVERTVEVVPEDVQRRIKSLEKETERLNAEYQKVWQEKMNLDKKLDQANELLGEKKRTDNAQWDIEVLTTATNNYLRQYGGKAWAFDQFYRVDEITQQEFERAITNLAAFAQNLAQMIQEKKQLGKSDD